jgi:hypothetical protein
VTVLSFAKLLAGVGSPEVAVKRPLDPEQREAQDQITLGEAQELVRVRLCAIELGVRSTVASPDEQRAYAYGFNALVCGFRGVLLSVLGTDPPGVERKVRQDGFLGLGALLPATLERRPVVVVVSRSRLLEQLRFAAEAVDNLLELIG